MRLKFIILSSILTLSSIAVQSSEPSDDITVTVTPTDNNEGGEDGDGDILQFNFII